MNSEPKGLYLRKLVSTALMTGYSVNTQNTSIAIRIKA